jgi:hypothetical protein
VGFVAEIADRDLIFQRHLGVVEDAPPLKAERMLGDLRSVRQLDERVGKLVDGHRAVDRSRGQRAQAEAGRPELIAFEKTTVVIIETKTVAALDGTQPSGWERKNRSLLLMTVANEMLSVIEAAWWVSSWLFRSLRGVCVDVDMR